MGKDRSSPRIDFGIRVGAVVARNGALLLVRRQKPDRDTYWAQRFVHEALKLGTFPNYTHTL